MIPSALFEILRTDLPPLVRNFKQSSATKWGWSCDLCGDSRKNPRKARFGCSLVDQQLVCNCFNCGWSGTFFGYLTYQHPDLAQKVQRQNFLVKQQHDDENRYHDSIISQCDSETLKELYYINHSSNTKEWLDLLISKKIVIKHKSNHEKLLKIHKEVYNVK